MKGKIIATLLIGIIALGSYLIFFNDIDNNPIDYSASSELRRFSSYDEFRDFVKKNSNAQGRIGGFGDFAVAEGFQAAPSIASADSKSAGASTYSRTNIQVEGVDEPDIVKNDGKYIYTLSGNTVFIVDAYPASEIRVLSNISLNNTGFRNIFVNNDKLIIFSDEYVRDDSCSSVSEEGYKLGIPCIIRGESRTSVYIYDISDRNNPKQIKNISFSGNYVDSRMIGDYIYTVSQNYIDINYPVFPMYRINGVESSIAIEDIYYSPLSDESFVFTSISAIEVDGDGFNNKVYLLGSSNQIYVSQDNIYLTYTKYIRYEVRSERLLKEDIIPMLPSELKAKVEGIINSDKDTYEKVRLSWLEIYNYSSSLRGEEKARFDEMLRNKSVEFENRISKESEKTIINKISVDEDDIDYIDQGEVSCHLFNKSSMEEYNDNFRIATTTGGWGGNNLNHLFILDEDLDIQGKVEDLAEGERIYSVRFMGERAYMVTFRQVDPLFVIDLKDARNPRVLGFLKVTGYSSYLHPYDENHIIGIGMEANEQGRVSGLKVALFDVSDVANPKEKAKFVIENYSSSTALYEHKAFLFDRDKNLLVIPVYVYDYAMYRNSWNGAYVFYIDDEELRLKGKLTHYDYKEPMYGPARDEEIGATRIDKQGIIWTKIGLDQYGQGLWKSNESSVIHYDYTIDGFPGGINDYIYEYGYDIQRSLYMDDILYTVSLRKIKANALDDAREIGRVELPYSTYSYPVFYGREVAV